jgi:hypothetical protein
LIPTKKQQEFLNQTKRVNLIAGDVSSGKTVAGLMKAVKFAEENKNSRVLVLVRNLHSNYHFSIIRFLITLENNFSIRRSQFEFTNGSVIKMQSGYNIPSAIRYNYIFSDLDTFNLTDLSALGEKNVEISVVINEDISITNFTIDDTPYLPINYTEAINNG